MKRTYAVAAALEQSTPKTQRSGDRLSHSIVFFRRIEATIPRLFRSLWATPQCARLRSHRLFQLHWLSPSPAASSHRSRRIYSVSMGDDQRRLWCEEDIEEGLRWSYAVKEVLHTGQSEFQTVELFDTLPWGKTLLLDGKLQSADADENLYHECTTTTTVSRR